MTYRRGRALKGLAARPLCGDNDSPYIQLAWGRKVYIRFAWKAALRREILQRRCRRRTSRSCAGEPPHATLNVQNDERAGPKARPLHNC